MSKEDVRYLEGTTCAALFDTHPVLPVFLFEEND